MDQLLVWLNDVAVATVERERDRLRLRYTPTAVDEFELGTPLLSWALPLTEDSYPNGVTCAFLDGLLPEADARRKIADDLGLRAGDTFELMAALGRDCAGALVIQAEGNPLPPPATTSTAEPLDAAGLEALVANLHVAPLGVDARVRVSLGGVQEKLLLTKMPDGSWGRPVDGTPSTHILKPEIRGYERTVANEHFCMLVAAGLDIPVAATEALRIGEADALVVERFDRTVARNGDVMRLHQEDICQATGLPPFKKYQEDGGPSLQLLASILQSVSDFAGLEQLLRATVVNVALGNGDAHAKNFSLVHRVDGAVRLAPFYDLMSTMVYGDNHLAMYVDSVQRIDRAVSTRIVNEAVSWGLPRERAAEIVAGIVERFPDAFAAARRDVGVLPEGFDRVLEKQLKLLSDPA